MLNADGGLKRKVNCEESLQEVGNISEEGGGFHKIMELWKEH